MQNMLKSKKLWPEPKSPVVFLLQIKLLKILCGECDPLLPLHCLCLIQRDIRKLLAKGNKPANVWNHKPSAFQCSKILKLK